MSEASIPVDLFNPGQVFACLGFLEAADLLVGDAEGGFDWNDPTCARFKIRSRGNGDAVQLVLDFLAGSHVQSLAPPGSLHRTEKWNVHTQLLKAGEPFPFLVPSSPATLPAVLTCPDSKHTGTVDRIVIDYWGEQTDRTGRDNAKFWGGAGGYPGAALARDAIANLKALDRSARADPFSFEAPQSSSFRLDWRRDYIPIDAGFSLNSHSNTMTSVGFPLVEILAAIGLTHARPKKIDRSEYVYSVLGHGACPDQAFRHGLFAPVLVRASLGGAPLGLPCRRFRMFLGSPGEEGKDRCITSVIEETFL
ncbi:MAG TPA: type I-U CRISPR-associated protein Cas8c [Vicinamibacterales bacterium]|jgi:CRISPR-associated protein Csx14